MTGYAWKNDEVIIIPMDSYVDVATAIKEKILNCPFYDPLAEKQEIGYFGIANDSHTGYDYCWYDMPMEWLPQEFKTQLLLLGAFK